MHYLRPCGSAGPSWNSLRPRAPAVWAVLCKAGCSDRSLLGITLGDGLRGSNLHSASSAREGGVRGPLLFSGWCEGGERAVNGQRESLAVLTDPCRRGRRRSSAGHAANMTQTQRAVFQHLPNLHQHWASCRVLLFFVFFLRVESFTLSPVYAHPLVVASAFHHF